MEGAYSNEQVFCVLEQDHCLYDHENIRLCIGSQMCSTLCPAHAFSTSG